MVELIGSIFSCIFGIIKLVFELVWAILQLAFGLIGGIFSLVVTLAGILIVGALILVVVLRRREKKQEGSPAGDETRTYDVDKEEFTSFYDQFRNQD